MKDTKLVGVLNIVWGVMGITGGVIGAAIMLLPILLAESGYNVRIGRGELETVTTILTIVGGVIFAVAVLVSLPSIIGGIGLLRGLPWARTLVLVLSFIHLIAFPLGTALGIYGIYVLWDQPMDVGQQRQTGQPSPPPGPMN